MFFSSGGIRIRSGWDFLIDVGNGVIVVEFDAIESEFFVDRYFFAKATVGRTVGPKGSAPS